MSVSAVTSAIIALPLLPVNDVGGSPVAALNNDALETIGWPEFTRTRRRRGRDAAPEQRASAILFTSNYGEAGAIDHLGGAFGLPRAYSGHNSYSDWGIPPERRGSGRGDRVHATLLCRHVLERLQRCCARRQWSRRRQRGARRPNLGLRRPQAIVGRHVGRSDLVRLTGTLIAVFPAALVFDFDGTMVDTETAVYEAVRRTFADFGLELAPDAWMQAAGTMWGASWVDDLVEATGGAVDAHQARRRNRVHSAEIDDLTVLRPGLQALLDDARAHRIPMAITSNSASDWIEHHLDRLGLTDYFPVLAHDRPGRTGQALPRSLPEGVPAARRRADEQRRVRGLGSGTQSAAAAGMFVIAAPGPMTAGPRPQRRASAHRRVRGVHAARRGARH